MSSDAYATGQALYALHASGMSPQETVYQRGVTSWAVIALTHSL